ncbi:MAG: hypothetical protein ACE5HN_01070 [Nitrospiria bacterium]
MDPIVPTEVLTRYVLDRNSYKPSEVRVKHNAFMPPSSLRLSVYRSSELSENTIWELGDRNVAAPRSKPLIGRADILALAVLDADEELKVEPDPTPHPRHANIAGWPAQKDKQKLIAIKLANNAKFFLKPST